METLNYLLGYENIKIYQNNDMFKFSLDSILLPNFVTINKNIKRILDIGTGNAIIPIVLALKTSAKIEGVEIQKEVSVLANKSVKYNKLENQIEIINDDIKNYVKNTQSETFDIITCNPPFFKVNENSHLNESKYKVIARHEVMINLEDILEISKKLLKNDGILGLVHRPERLVDILTTMRKYNIEPKKIQFVYPSKEKQSNILLIEGVKNGKPGLKILEPIYSHNIDGSYTEQIIKYFS